MCFIYQDRRVSTMTWSLTARCLIRIKRCVLCWLVSFDSIVSPYWLSLPWHCCRGHRLRCHCLVHHQCASACARIRVSWLLLLYRAGRLGPCATRGRHTELRTRLPSLSQPAAPPYHVRRTSLPDDRQAYTIGILQHMDAHGRNAAASATRAEARRGNMHPQNLAGTHSANCPRSNHAPTADTWTARTNNSEVTHLEFRYTDSGNSMNSHRRDCLWATHIADYLRLRGSTTRGRTEGEGINQYSQVDSQSGTNNILHALDCVTAIPMWKIVTTT